MTPDDDFTRDHEQEHRDEGEWVSNEPPVDDFGDEHAAEAEAATVSEGDDHEAEDQSDAGIEEKKGFPLMLLFGAVASLAVVGGLAYWHFGSHNEQQPSLLDQAQGAHETAPNFVAKAPAEGAEAKLQTAVISTTPAPPPTAPTTAYSVPTVTVDVPEKGASQGSAMPAAPAAPVAPSIQAMPSAPEQPVAAKAAPQETAAPVTAVDDERLTALSARMDDLQKSLGQTVQQLGQIDDKLSSAARPDAAIEERLNHLEQKLTQLEQQPAKPTDLVLPAQRKQPVAETAPDAMPMETPAIVTKKSRHEMAAATKRSFAFKHHKLASASPKFANNRWVLRAATPDEAWIAKNSETRELRPVHVGDMVDGVGRVTAIEQVGATWVVQGTHGTIR